MKENVADSLHCVSPCHVQTCSGSHSVGEEILDAGVVQRAHTH